MWRDDGKCGDYYYFLDGAVAQCDHGGDKPCCSKRNEGECGNKAKHCSCRFCTNYTRLYKDWEETSGKQKWRDDGKCGDLYRLPDGTPAQCDPDGKNPCCGNKVIGKCGNTKDFCTCTKCTNYTRLYENWETSKGRNKFRHDGKCGRFFPLPDGAPGECNPDGDSPCCDRRGWCVNSKSSTCLCTGCVDYRVVREIRKSGENCTLATLQSGFLKHACFDVVRNHIFYRCVNSDGYYTAHYSDSLDGVSAVCDNDPHFYQACGFNKKGTVSDVLCGGYFCRQREAGKVKHEYVQCTGDNCKSASRHCVTKRSFYFTASISHPTLNTSPKDSINESTSPKPSTGSSKFSDGPGQFSSSSIIITSPIEVTSAPYKNKVHMIYCKAGRESPIPVYRVCDGFKDCDNGSDEDNCTLIDSASDKTCTHYLMKVENNKVQTVPILNFTRCSLFDVSNQTYPYCLNYLDQTNCSDTERVGGFCKVNGYMSTVSRYMNCYEYDQKTGRDIQLCDDGIQNKCISPSTSDCRVHRHLICDGVKDCANKSDETHHICGLMTEELDFACKRRFQRQSGDTRIPISWIMDNVTDCMNGEDENSSLWAVCPGKVISPEEFPCRNVFLCPRVRNTTSVLLRHLCNGIESCGNKGRENEVCKIARDFPSLNTTANMSSDSVRNVCMSDHCKRREFIRPWGSVLETKIKLLVPKWKIQCGQLFGEYYLYLSCMGLCKDTNVLCPLDGEKRKLEYDSCPGQFPDRVNTLGNNSFLTFAVKSDEGHYHQNFYRCNNNRCIEYSQVCDLVDDCGDMSDEVNCANNMICQDTVNLTKHHFISSSQICDGIYDSFDLSDECNESCGRQILEHWVLKSVCWSMGILSVIFNVCSIFHGLRSLRNCKTAGMVVSKVLLSLIALGDFLMGIYLITLSVYDSFIFGDEFCKEQTEWLTGTPCLMLGVISTVGSQISLFSMTVFSFIRMYGLLYRSMRIPGPVTRKSLTKIIVLVSAMLTSSLVIALIPLVPFLEDYFVQGMYYDPSYKIFIGFPTKGRHIDVLKAYYEHTNSSSNHIPEDMSWRDINEKVNGMFSQHYGSLVGRPVHFYGNDGVCLFKYFVRTDDARRSRKLQGSGVEMNDPVVWTMLIVNLICFFIITYCYIRVVRNTRQSTQTSGQCDNPQRLREIRAMENRIMVIIGTDFLCWVPFIFISGLHNLGAINASSWYTFFAMTVLPLNSVINPLIYDKAIGEFIVSNFLRLIGLIRQRISSAVVVITELFRTRNNNNEPETIPMEIIIPQCDNENLS